MTDFLDADAAMLKPDLYLIFYRGDGVALNFSGVRGRSTLTKGHSRTVHGWINEKSRVIDQRALSARNRVMLGQKPVE